MGFVSKALQCHNHEMDRFAVTEQKVENTRVIMSLTRSQMLQKSPPVASRSAKDQYMPRLALAMATSIRTMLKSIMLRLPR